MADLINDASNFDEFIPDTWLDIKDQDTGEEFKAGFSVRPFAIECLRKAN